MNNFQIETAQNVSIYQNVAGIGERILAFLIDGVVIFTYWIVAIVLISAFNVDSKNGI